MVEKGRIITQTRITHLRHRNQRRQVDNAVFLSGYCDASFHPETREGGFGAWVRDDRQRVIVAGPTPAWAVNANLTELAALFAAIYIGVTRLDAARANIFVVKTDSQIAASWLGWSSPDQWGGPNCRHPFPKKHPRAMEIIHNTWKLAEDHDLKLIVKWVKGHQGTGTTVGWLNNRVDKMARKARLSKEKSCFREVISPT